MHVKRVEIENIRGFGSGNRGVNLDLERPDGSLAGWTVLAGRNGAGKSTFLRAVAMALTGPYAAMMLQESFAGWVRHEQSGAHVETQIRFMPDRDNFEGRRQSPPRDDFRAKLSWARPPGATELTFRGEFPEKPVGLKLAGGPWSDEPQGWFVAGYGPFRRLSGHASDAQRLMAAPNHVSRLVSLFREDASLVECV